MKVLLINPNRYKFPPVPPIGLEHIAASLERGGHQPEITDLCFSDSPYEDIDSAIHSMRPDIVGITVRNIDSVLYTGNEFYLDEIQGIIGYIKSRHGLKVIIGGTGVSVNPEGVLEYLHADYAIVGPADDVINSALREILETDSAARIFVRKYRYEISCPRIHRGIQYPEYLDRGGMVGFETHKGCGSSCVYCIEANTGVCFKPISAVLDELMVLHGAGYRKFHLCDSEFNEDIDYCLDFLSALRKSDIDMEWTLYMKPANYNRKLFRMMKETGVFLITLTVDSWKKCPLYWTDIEKIIFSARSAGIRVVVDFLAGFPYENEDTLIWYLDMFRRIQPDSVGINTFIRLYKSIQITQIIMNDPALRRNVIGCADEGTFLKPVFYNHVSTEKLSELISGDPLFRIEGGEKGVNYSRRPSLQARRKA